MSFSVRPATSDDAELTRFAEIVNEVTPEDPTELEELRWQDANYRGERFVAEVGDEAVGVASVGQIISYRPDFERWWVTVRVRESYRRRENRWPDLMIFFIADSSFVRSSGVKGCATSKS